MKLWLILFFISVNGFAQDKQFEKISLIVDVGLTDLSWTELGLLKEETFTAPITDSWIKWIQSNLPANVGTVELCEEACREQYRSWERIPQTDSMQIPASLQKTIWFKVSYELTRTAHNPALKEWKFAWSGSVVSLNARNKRIISSKNIQPMARTWRGLDQKALNSNLASALYRSPLSGFSQILTAIGETKGLNGISRLLIIGHQNMGDVVFLMELLKKEGRKLGLDVKIDSFGPKEAQLLCFYQGEEKSFSDLLSRIKELKSSQSYSIVNDFNGVHHRLQLVTD